MTAIDLRRAPLADIRALDLRSLERDLRADEAAMWDRFRACWAGLDDAAWRLPGAAPSDAGGPDWSLADHVAHVAAWQELSVEYVAAALQSGRWPSDDEFDGGDFDAYNERLRDAWLAIPPAEARARLGASHDRLLALSNRFSDAEIRRDDAWGWVYMSLHGHQLDHLGILEPWADRLRERQVEGDPFGSDPALGSGDAGADRRAFWADEARTFDELMALANAVPAARWEASEVTPGWTLRDHIGHLASWYEEGARAIDAHRRDGGWPGGPSEGIDSWNAREVERSRSLPVAEIRTRLEAGRGRLHELADRLAEPDFRSPEGWGWTYENLTGHVRSHVAMVAPWCVRASWPPPLDAPVPSGAVADLR